MTDKNARINTLREALMQLQDKRNLRDDPAWIDANAQIEADMMTRLLATSAGDDIARTHLVTAMQVHRRLRAIMEGRQVDAAAIERELDFLEGRKLAPVA